MEGIAHKVRPGKTTSSSERTNWQDLTKSTEYFPDSPPQRQEEDAEYSVDEQRLSFWKTSPSSVPPSSTPTKTADMDEDQSSTFSSSEGCLRDKCLSPCRDFPSLSFSLSLFLGNISRRSGHKYLHISK
uniref:Uncharacterized protein n=1 Tax=Tetraodon nigroviridis TaxID=99883 RepID=H3C1U3_TETNG